MKGYDFNELIGSGTGLYNLVRNLGASVGISTFLIRGEQKHQNYLVAHLNGSNPVYRCTLGQITGFLALHNGSAGVRHQALGYIYRSLRRQAEGRDEHKTSDCIPAASRRRKSDDKRLRRSSLAGGGLGNGGVAGCDMLEQPQFARQLFQPGPRGRSRRNQRQPHPVAAFAHKT